MAGEQGLGCTDLSAIKIMGERLDSVKRPFKRLSLDQTALEQMGIKVIECDACSGCHNAINAYLYTLQLDGELKKLQNCTLIYGQNPYLPEENTGKIVRLGTCTRGIKTETGVYVPGCPPHPLHIDDFLEGKGFEKE